ncbi:hypothetical protein MARA_54000 [Mycolicibacterium arabiense]|uniref:DUF4190 domain-containing protein n=1 Tax=Mycolicibacterium arabiense TaxID=1286181 RepID=A0A7I7S4X1_9MYCO|nr:DUF4190 domain-containing protein [Mycolicibacterium arabiense]MCV7372891.1 DUF4190 domain-containing protein [Mycolicibacterium arabiense]BBY51932.1 hypothetical protein MARA_54000 [Mycolicibacterium arabiense]
MTDQPPPPPGNYPPPPPQGGGYPPPPQGGGYPPPPQGGGYPPPPQGGGYPPPGGFGGGAPTKTNTLAIASLVCAVLGLLCGVGSILGIVLGVVALNQIKQTGENGRGLAQAGIVVGAIFVVLGIVGYAIYFS